LRYKGQGVSNKHWSAIGHIIPPAVKSPSREFKLTADAASAANIWDAICILKVFRITREQQAEQREPAKKDEGGWL
jgi:hypothetical protein